MGQSDKEDREYIKIDRPWDAEPFLQSNIKSWGFEVPKDERGWFRYIYINKVRNQISEEANKKAIELYRQSFVLRLWLNQYNYCTFILKVDKWGAKAVWQK